MTFERSVRLNNGRKMIAALFGGGIEIILQSEPKTTFLTASVKVDHTVPSNGESTSGTMHIDLSDAKDLRDTLTSWLNEHGVK